MYESRDSLLNAVNGILGDRQDDDALNFLKEITETYDRISPSPESVNWEQKYNELDAQWRKRYRDAFFSDTPAPVGQIPEDDETPIPEETIQITDLFKED